MLLMDSRIMEVIGKDIRVEINSDIFEVLTMPGHGKYCEEIEEFLNFLETIYSPEEILSHSGDIRELIMKYIELHD